MVFNRCEIVQATAEDIDGIIDLQERNQPERGGALSARLPREWLETAVAAMPVGAEGTVVAARVALAAELPEALVAVTR